jgi:hypothetical protein
MIFSFVVLGLCSNKCSNKQNREKVPYKKAPPCYEQSGAE